jgi:AraC-like DNA-binding protein
MEPPLQKIASRIRTIALLTQIYFLRSTKTIEPVVFDERIRNLLIYLEEHIREDISMDDLSNKFFITKNHLHFIFHKVVGTPIMKYVKTKRLGLVRQEILNGAQISEAAYRAGFNDYTTFYRAYKSFYGYAPSKLLINDVDTSIS